MAVFAYQTRDANRSGDSDHGYENRPVFPEGHRAMKDERAYHNRIEVLHGIWSDSFLGPLTLPRWRSSQHHCVFEAGHGIHFWHLARLPLGQALEASSLETRSSCSCPSCLR